MTDEEGLTKKSIEAEFPGREAFLRVDRRWHARIKGAEAPVMVDGEDLVDLRD
jgi:hypothetical protein